MRMTRLQRKLAVLFAIPLGVLFWGAALPEIEEWWEARARPGFAVSPEQIRRIAGAISEYEKAGGERPMRLTELVEAGLLDAAALLDERRDKSSEDETDVLYFPAVRRDDPADLVLLCALLPRSRKQCHVIANDGSYTVMPAHDLVMALNRTYTYIGKEIMKARSTSAPVAADRIEKE